MPELNFTVVYCRSFKTLRFLKLLEVSGFCNAAVSEFYDFLSVGVLGFNDCQNFKILRFLDFWDFTIAEVSGYYDCWSFGI